MQVWLAALIAGVAAGLAAAVKALLGKRQVERAAPAAAETLDSVKQYRALNNVARQITMVPTIPSVQLRRLYVVDG
jgi:hypothetical protein